jgi:hypothetical protein
MVAQLGQLDNYSVCSDIHVVCAVQVLSDAKSTASVTNFPDCVY